jgi:spermidine/putrescine transport system permease protein
MRRAALLLEAVAILAVFASFFAGEARHAVFFGGAALFAGAAVLGAFGTRRSMPGFWLWFVSLAVYAFLYIPLAIVVIFSFNESKLNAEWVRFTTAWYGRLLANEAMLQAAGNSLLIALVSASLGRVDIYDNQQNAATRLTNETKRSASFS